MNIIILSASPINKASGGLAIDLFQSFSKAGHKVIIFTPYCNSIKTESVIEINNKFVCIKEKFFRSFNRNFKKYFTKTDPNYYFQDYDLTKSKCYYKKIIQKLPFNPNAFIYLFPQYFLNMYDLYKLNQITGAPILWYMMDMFPITGGCHYAWDCKGYENSCGNCPGLYSNDAKDQTHLNWKYKKKYIDKTDVIPIAGTEWQFQQLLRSSLFLDKKKYKVFLSIDPKVFKPNDKTITRKELKIPIDKRIIFFGAVNITEKRKGFNELIEALLILRRLLGERRSDCLHIIIAGNKSKEFSSVLPFSNTFLGYLSQKQLPKAFQSADIFLSSSIEDSGPMMINQSIMSGSPVVAFEMGVALDLVITGKTGYRAKLKDSEDLARGIKYILDLNEIEYNKISDNCRKLGLSLLHPEKTTTDFLKIITEKQNEN